MDDLTVDLPTGRPEVLRAAVEEVPGVGAEGIRPTESVRAPLLAPLELPAALAQTEPSSVLKRLIEGMPKTLFANWSWAFHGYDGRPTVIAASVGAPSLSNIETPWLPLEDARRLAPAQWMPPAWRMGPGSCSGFPPRFLFCGARRAAKQTALHYNRIASTDAIGPNRLDGKEYLDSSHRPLTLADEQMNRGRLRRRLQWRS